MKLLLILLISQTLLFAHHFKGLPHYGYFENYPQIPQTEFLGQDGKYEISLVIYDFQGINLQDAQYPGEARLYSVVYDLKNNSVYKGAAKVQIFDGDTMLEEKYQPQAEEESIYQINRKLNSEGDYSLKLVLVDDNNFEVRVPFILESQKTHWGKWVSFVLFLLLFMTAIGARKKRVTMDRKEKLLEQSNES
ncbi:MAG: hypothetical protein COB02_10515 [Candidatus Cloacimonadota bacterium]|nr:MAG: hypothetical protein COB02_10515 [Candidatus Cloacimonadota bacterium]